ncbi:MAG: YggS family pyridoxal phosphate-dependent enzyme [Chloroflexi bacterium]|nr:YggS family pyridoxal phosphate-dependent enzyme [Chloroflexota bacterium]MYF22059.1 YggS family pyridoxal phosphate-dependent enzyme [Chloroflexota bacterium]
MRLQRASGCAPPTCGASTDRCPGAADQVPGRQWRPVSLRDFSSASSPSTSEKRQPSPVRRPRSAAICAASAAATRFRPTRPTSCRSKPSAEADVSIASNLDRVSQQIADACHRAGRDPSAVSLIAVSKTFPVSAIAEAAAAGQRQFGENRVQEALAKIEQLPSHGIEVNEDIDLHLIGHLQRNKARHAGQFASVQSVDSVRLAAAISRRLERELPVLLEVNVGQEASKEGFAVCDVSEAFEQISVLPNLRIDGLMTVAPEVADPEQVRPVFRTLRELAERLSLSELSMGMTNDYSVAIEEGSTMVRVGRAIFGERPSAPGGGLR